MARIIDNERCPEGKIPHLRSGQHGQESHFCGNRLGGGIEIHITELADNRKQGLLAGQQQNVRFLYGQCINRGSIRGPGNRRRYFQCLPPCLGQENSIEGNGDLRCHRAEGQYLHLSEIGADSGHPGKMSSRQFQYSGFILGPHTRGRDADLFGLIHYTGLALCLQGKSCVSI